MAFGVLSVGWVFLQQVRKKEVSPELVAAAFLALPYAHYAYSRADIGHLALEIFPFLIAYLIIIAKKDDKTKCSLVFLPCSTSVYLMYVYHPGWQYRNHIQPVAIKISGSTLFVDQETAKDVALLRRLADEYAPHGESILAMPFWPGADALLERPSPIREIYPLLPVSNSFQQQEIQQIKTSKPQCVLLLDVPLDWRDDLRFKKTHPLIYQYILERFEPVAGFANPPYFIYNAKQDRPE